MIRFIISTPLGVQPNFTHQFNIHLANHALMKIVIAKEKQPQIMRTLLRGRLFIMSMPVEPFVALTAFYKRNIFEKLDVKATYTFDPYSNKNIRLGFSGTLGKFNMYLLVDNVLEYKEVPLEGQWHLRFSSVLILFFKTLRINFLIL